MDLKEDEIESSGIVRLKSRTSDLFCPTR